MNGKLNFYCSRVFNQYTMHRNSTLQVVMANLNQINNSLRLYS